MASKRLALAAVLAFVPLAALAQTTASPPPAPAAVAPTAAPTAAAPTAAAPQAMAASPHMVANGDMLTTLRSSGHFTILVKALDATNLSPILKATPDLTLFAPTDEAFQALPASELATLMATKNAPILQKILTYHLVHLNLDSAKFKGAKGPVQTVENSSLQVDGSGAVVKVNNADIIQADVHATNGTIQVIDKVLIPTDVQVPTASAQLSRPPAQADARHRGASTGLMAWTAGPIAPARFSPRSRSIRRRHDRLSPPVVPGSHPGAPPVLAGAGLRDRPAL